MTTMTMSHALTRSHRLRTLIDQERRRTGGPRLRLLRLQRLLLHVQLRLAAALERATMHSVRGAPA